MEENIIGFRVDVSTEAGQATVGDLRREFIEAKKAAMEAKEGTVEYDRALLKLAEKKARINDLNQAVRGLDPDNLISNFTRLGGVMVGGFSAAQSAALLFSKESENIQRALMKVQAAMGLLQGFEAIKEGVKAFEIMRVAINGAATSLGTFKTVLISSGIGAAVVAIGYLINAFNKLSEVSEIKLKPALTEQEKTLIELQLQYDNLTGKISNATLEMELLALTHREKVTEIENEAAEKLNEAGKWYNRLKDHFISFTNEYLGIKLGEVASEVAIERDKNKKLEEEDKEYELKKKIKTEEHHQQFKQRQKDRYEELKRLRDEYLDDELEANKRYWENLFITFGEGAKSEAQQKQELQDTLDSMQAQSDVMQVKSITGAVHVKLKIRNEDKEQAIANAKALIAIETGVFSTISGIGSIFIKNEQKLDAFQKKAAAIRVIVDQAQALSSAVKMAIAAAAPAAIAAGPAGPLVVAGYVASAIASVTAIFGGIKTLLSKAGGIGGVSLDSFGGSIGSFSPPSVSITPPDLNNESTTLGGTTGSAPPPAHPIIKTFVVESDITSMQDRIKMLEGRATFG